MSYQENKLMNLKDGRKVLETVDGKITDLKSALKYEMDCIRETTENLNTAKPARKYPSGSGVITDGSEKHMGMANRIPCTAGETYTVTVFDSEVSSACTIYISWYSDDSDESHIQRDSDDVASTALYYSATAPAGANYMFAAVRNNTAVSANTKLMITAGSTPAETYELPYDAVDRIARETPSEHSLNLLDALPLSIVGNASYEKNGNGYKIVAGKASTSPAIRFAVINSVAQADVGRVFTFTASLTAISAELTRINFLSNNSNRKATTAATVGNYAVTYEITASDVGRTLYVALYGSNSNVAVGDYSVWHDIQLVESNLVMPYMGLKTAVDSTARARIAEILRGDAVNEHSVTLTESVTYKVMTKNPCVLALKCRAKYTGTQPTVVFSNSLYTSPVYDIGGSEYKMQSWRIPPDVAQTMTTITITVASGSTLDIDYIYTEEVANNPANHDARPTLCAHLGFTQMCPQNTKPGFEMAGMLGYPALIITPQITQDGEIVCIHDETINATAVDADGNAPSTEMAVIDMTYSQLLEWDFGRKKNVYWTGARIPTIEEFFQICAKYGMAPVFSTHPNVLPSVWGTKCAEVKALLIKYGLLKKFHFKAFDMRYINAAYAVFGQDIDGYTGEHGDSYVSISELTSFVSTNNIDTKKCRVVSEKSINSITESYISDVLTAGLECGCYTITSSNSAATVKQLIEWGVTSFTDDSFCQNGMSWY